VQDDNESTAPRLPDLPYHPPSGGREPEEMPTWPAIERQSPRARSGSVPATTLATGLAVSLVANGALLVALASVLLFAHAGFLSPRSPSSHSTPPASSVTNTASALPSSTPSSGWLGVAPSSVQLGCDGGQDTQFVVLTNTGAADVQWQVEFSVSADQAGVTVDPMQGDLNAGTSIALQISNTFQADAQRGVLRFAPDSSAAGEAPRLAYTTSTCS
jgi:hypothetical protein